MIEVRPLTDPGELNELLRQVPLQPFLQSWTWGEFQQAYGRKIWRLGAFADGQLVGAMTLIQHQLMMGKAYMYVPRGPVAISPKVAKVLWEAARTTGQEAGEMYVKIDPPPYPFEFDLNQVANYEPGTTLQEPNTLWLDIRPTEDELLQQMHQKTRYNLRLAQKRGVQVRWSTTDKDFQRYLELQKEMADRQGIRLHPGRYYRTMFETYRAAKAGELAIAELDGQSLAINFIIWHEQTGIYNHGGSTQAHKDAMAPYLLQWQTIRRAKAKGMSHYDFRGVAPEDHPEHKLAGVTRFKLGFGGQRIIYPSAYNTILDRPWWHLYRFAKRMRGGVDG